VPDQAESFPAGIDTSRPSVARMYDYYLDGKDNYAVDRAAVAKVAEVLPEVRQVARENRAFLRRAVRYMARQGIRQFIDVGSGLPTAGNTHEIAQEIIPGARVVYVDNDPVVLAHGRALLAADDNTTVATADLHNPDDVLGHAETTRLIDFDEPVGILLIAMVHFLTSEERPKVMGRLRDALAPGSHITATHHLDGRSVGGRGRADRSGLRDHADADLSPLSGGDLTLLRRSRAGRARPGHAARLAAGPGGPGTGPDPVDVRRDRAQGLIAPG
jgi:hypothetical protein